MYLDLDIGITQGNFSIGEQADLRRQLLLGVGNEPVAPGKGDVLGCVSLSSACSRIFCWFQL